MQQTLDSFFLFLAIKQQDTNQDSFAIEDQHGQARQTGHRREAFSDNPLSLILTQERSCIAPCRSTATFLLQAPQPTRPVQPRKPNLILKMEQQPALLPPSLLSLVLELENDEPFRNRDHFIMILLVSFLPLHLPQVLHCGEHLCCCLIVGLPFSYRKR